MFYRNTNPVSYNASHLGVLEVRRPDILESATARGIRLSFRIKMQSSKLSPMQKCGKNMENIETNISTTLRKYKIRT